MFFSRKACIINPSQNDLQSDFASQKNQFFVSFNIPRFRNRRRKVFAFAIKACSVNALILLILKISQILSKTGCNADVEGF